MTELERKAVKQSLTYNRKYSEDRNLEKVLKYPEEYVDSYAYTMNIVQMLRQKAYRDGFIAGAKENEFVWHDLRKDPNDLPTHYNTGISDYVITDRGFGYYNDRVKSWWIKNDCALTDKVIAWCEIPKLEMEE